MRYQTVCFLALVLLMTGASFPCRPQSNTPSPVDHMTQITAIDNELQKKYLSYMSTVAHTNNARKSEKRRQELLNSIQESVRTTGRIRLYNGDASLRDTYLQYLRILQTVFREDYHKIVDMEEIAEQSYDKMEAYLMAKEQAGDKLQEAAEKIEPAYQEFASKNNVKLVEPDKESKLSRKLKMVSEVNQYYHKIYLIFFKSYHQEKYMLNAMEAQDLNAVEQNRNTLLKYSEEGLATLDTLRNFKGDGSLINNCRKVLEFYKMEAGTKMTVITDYLLKRDEFEKLKKAIEAKPQRTQADVDEYNKAVNEMNASVNLFNKTNQDLYNTRGKLLENWNNSVKRFLDTYIPSAKL